LKINESEWFYNSLYKKWELYLFRLFKLADYIEGIQRIHRLNAPMLDDLLTPEGFENEQIRIPPNPFLMGKDDEIFFMFYQDLIDLRFSDTNKDNIRLLNEIWKRMGEIKKFLGITKGTRYVGEEREEWRLINELDWYIEYPEHAPMIYSIILGDTQKEKVMLKKFKNFLRDRSKSQGIKSLKYY